ALVLVFYFLAIGKYNPLYAWAVETLGVTGMRNPSKFLFFSIVSLGMLSGFGLQKVLELQKEAWVRRWKKIAVVLCFIVLLTPSSVMFFFKAFETRLTVLGRSYATAYFEGKQDPAHALGYYQDQMAGYLIAVKQFIQASDPWNVAALGASLLSAVILFVYFKNRNRRFLKIALLVFTVLDLSVFGYKLSTGFIGNARPFPSSRPPALKRLAALEAESSAGKNAVEWAAAGRGIFQASTNMLYGMPHAGGYSPLFLKRYYELFYDLGFVDGSLGRHPLDESLWSEQRPLLDLAGVSVVLSDQALTVPGLELKERVGDRFLYQNKEALALVHGVSSWRLIPEKKERLGYLKSRSFGPATEAVVEEPLGFSALTPVSPIEVLGIEKTALSIRAETRSDTSAILIFRSAFYPRWKARVDGMDRRTFPVDHAFTGVELSAGGHRVEFYYDMLPERRWQFVSLAVLFVLILVNGVKWPKRS
ncbi:MAG: hypothetical protein HYZ87_04255, partial [Candidatus Omnitrophica bacterium]|nr:hypothetical protein [Candidatus Omnitrophota bacterium]